jgi:O-antigen/teichoic acid export membrane protein
MEPAVPPARVRSVRSRFQTGVSFNLIGAVFNQGSTFAFSVIAANLLGRQTFGEYAMVQSTVTSLALIAQFAIPYTTTKYVAEFRESNPERAGRILGRLSVLSAITAGSVSVAFLVLTPWIATSVLRTPSLVAPLALSAAVLLIIALNGFLTGALSGLESYRALAMAFTWSGASYLIVCSTLAWWGGLNGAIIGLALSGIIQSILLRSALRRESLLQGLRPRYDSFAGERDIVLKFTLPAGLIGFTSGPAIWLPSAFLIRQPSGYSQIAIYSASFSLMAVVLFLPAIANTVGTSIINYHKGAGNRSEYRQTFWVNLAVTAVILVFGVGLFALLGPELLRLFGKSFKEGYSVLLILLLSTLPQGLALAMTQIVQTQRKLWMFFLAVAIPRDLLTIFLAYLLIPAYGARGLATAYAIGWTVALLTTASIVFHLGIDLAPRKARLLRDASF